MSNTIVSPTRRPHGVRCYFHPVSCLVWSSVERMPLVIFSLPSDRISCSASFLSFQYCNRWFCKPMLPRELRLVLATGWVLSCRLDVTSVVVLYWWACQLVFLVPLLVLPHCLMRFMEKAMMV